jgi:hypothetical protein
MSGQGLIRSDGLVVNCLYLSVLSALECCVQTGTVALFFLCQPIFIFVSTMSLFSTALSQDCQLCLLQHFSRLLMDRDILDLENVPLFIDNDWIGTGKQYPKTNTPHEDYGPEKTD